MMDRQIDLKSQLCSCIEKYLFHQFIYYQHKLNGKDVFSKVQI